MKHFTIMIALVLLCGRCPILIQPQLTMIRAFGEFKQEYNEHQKN